MKHVGDQKGRELSLWQSCDLKRPAPAELDRSTNRGDGERSSHQQQAEQEVYAQVHEATFPEKNQQQQQLKLRVQRYLYTTYASDEVAIKRTLPNGSKPYRPWFPLSRVCSGRSTCPTMICRVPYLTWAPRSRRSGKRELSVPHHQSCRQLHRYKQPADDSLDKEIRSLPLFHSLPLPHSCDITECWFVFTTRVAPQDQAPIFFPPPGPDQLQHRQARAYFDVLCLLLRHVGVFTSQPDRPSFPTSHNVSPNALRCRPNINARPPLRALARPPRPRAADHAHHVLRFLR